MDGKDEQGLKTIRDKGLSLFGVVGDVISTVISWNEDVNQNVIEAKKMLLLEQYFNKADKQDKAIELLGNFIKDPQGNTLFNKILRLLDDSPPNPELTEHLSKVLKKIIEEGNFETLFEQHRYALGQIERLTPQAITIISDLTGGQCVLSSSSEIRRLSRVWEASYFHLKGHSIVLKKVYLKNK